MRDCALLSRKMAVDNQLCRKPEKLKRVMKIKTVSKNTSAGSQLCRLGKRAVFSAICGLGLWSSASGQTVLLLDLGSNESAANAPDFTKVGLNNYSWNNGTYYEWDYVAGTSFTLSMTNVGDWSPGSESLASDGFYNLSATGPAYFTLSGLPAGQTVTIYACYGWDGATRGAVMEYGGETNIISNPGTTANPGTATLQNLGRALVDANGSVNGRWYGQTGFDSEGQVGAMIFDVEPCQPVLTLNGANPMIIPINSTFTDPGATAVESCSDTALTVTTTGRVTNTVLGTYTLTYSALADGINNSITRTVNVVSSDFLNLDLAENGSGVPTPAGFNRLNWYGNNMSFAGEQSVAGGAYTVAFTNISGTWSPGGTTLDKDGFYENAGQTAGFSVSGLPTGSLVTLYACWAWDGAANAATITYAGSATTLAVGSGITDPSSTTLQNVGTAVADSSGTVSGTWTGGTHQGQVGGMIFGIQAPVGHSLSVLPPGFTNNCPAAVTFTAAAEAGANLQWYNNLNQPISGATNASLVLTNLHPSASGNFEVVASGAGWSVTNLVPVSIIDVAAPVMTMNGNATMLVPLNSRWVDPGVTAFDVCAGGSLTVSMSGTVDTSAAGEYDLTYSATTGDGVPGSLTRAVIVIDPANLQPDVQVALDFQSLSDYQGTASGFTALQLFDISYGLFGSTSVQDPTGSGLGYTLNFGNISSWDQSPYLGYNDISTAGFYNYGGNPATFSLTGLPTGMQVQIYAVYGWNGPADAAQIIYGGATNQLTTGITTNSPNPPTEADFQLVGSAVVVDGTVSGIWYGPTGPTSEGQIGGMIINLQSVLVHDVAVTPAVTMPLCGSNVTFVASAAGYGPFTYQWYDNHTNLITGATNATYTLANVRATNAGNYTVVVHNLNNAGAATNLVFIEGVSDSGAPVMTLNGLNPANVLVNSGAYVDAGATAYDLCGEAFVPVHSNNAVNVAVVGSYTVTYTATTGNGNPGSITRTVNVVPNQTLDLDFAPTGEVEPAPAGFTKIQNGAALTPGNYDFPAVAGSLFDLSFTNIGSYNTANTNEPLTTDGFYSYAADGPAYFTLGSLPPGSKVALYAIYAWDGAPKYADVFFGGTNVQIVYTTDPGTAPTLSSFTRIGASMVGSSGTLGGYWQGPGGPNTEGQVGAMVIMIGTNTPPRAVPMSLNATNGVPATLQMVGNPAGPSDPDGDPLTVTAVQSPTPHGGSVINGGTGVTYTSAAAFAGTDTFTYSVGDGFGGFATNLVTVSVAAFVANNPTNITFGVSGSTLKLDWPADHSAWILQAQTNGLLSNNWFDVGSGGGTNAAISINPLNKTVFYRLRHP